MAAFSGKDGSVVIQSTWTNADFNVFSWTITESREALDTTPFGATGGWRTKVAGLNTWSGSYEGYLDGTTAPDTITAGASGIGTFTATTGRTYTGTIIVTEITPNVVVDGVGGYTVSFEGSGALTKA